MDKDEEWCSALRHWNARNKPVSRNLLIKQTRKGSSKVFPENSSSPGDANLAKEANQYAFNMEKMKSRTAVKQEIYRPAEEISLPDVAI